MIPATRLLASALLVALGCATSHPENPALDTFPPGVVGSTDVTYYDIHGRTAAELVAEMRRAGPKTSEGSFLGETQSPVRWTWQTRSSGESCQLSSIKVVVNSQITLPRWAPPADTEPGLFAQWNTFLADLATHEIGHKDISARGAKAILGRLHAINTSCASLNEEIRRRTDGIMTATRQEQVAYDADTRHGATQGAVFSFRSVRPRAADASEAPHGNPAATVARYQASDPIPGCNELLEGRWVSSALLNRIFPVRLISRSLLLDTLPLAGFPTLQKPGALMMAVRSRTGADSLRPFEFWQRPSPGSDRIMVGSPVPLGGASLLLHASVEGLEGDIRTFTDAIPPDGITSASAPIKLTRVSCP